MKIEKKEEDRSNSYLEDYVKLLEKELKKS